VRSSFRSENHPPLARSTGDMTFNRTGSWRYLRPVYQEKLAPCRNSCPAGTDLPRVLRLIGEEKFEEAYRTIRRENPLSGVCGHVCYHPCETLCSRSQLDGGISVQALERFVSDMHGHLPVEKPEVLRRESIAIIGSGPAGLSCAYYLAQQGFRVHIYEAAEKPGGMLRIGIPKYRMPRKVLDREIQHILDLGVELTCNCRIGRDISLQELLDKHDAVFIATGAHRSRTIGLGTSPEGPIWSGLRFLDRVNQETDPDIGRKAVIIGGGNTAIDAARVALRLGAEPTIVYRRTRAEMPAHETEIADAEKEGVEFIFLATPSTVHEEEGQLQIEFTRMRLGAPGPDGRRRPEPIPGDTFTMRADSLIEAVGEEPDLDFLGSFASMEDVFVGGDASTGPSTVVDAVAAGKETARRIRKFLGYKDPDQPAPVQLQPFQREALNYDHFPTIRPTVVPKLPPEERKTGFEEIIRSLDPEEAVHEAHRCFSCGVCNSCDNCYIFCPDAAITRNGTSYSIDLDYCKGCGICVQECPRGVITLVREEL